MATPKGMKFGYKIKVTGAIIDSSSGKKIIGEGPVRTQKRTKEEMDVLAERIENQFRESFEIETENLKVEVEIDIRSVESPEGFRPEDHRIAIVDKVPKGKESTLGRVDQLGGKNLVINNRIVNRTPQNSRSGGTFERTGAHELGHTLGLGHDDPEIESEDNLMHQTKTSSGTKIDPGQIKKAYKQFKERGLNKPYDPSWSNSRRNQDDRNKKKKNS